MLHFLSIAGYYDKQFMETVISNADTLERWSLNAFLHVGSCLVFFFKREEGYQKETGKWKQLAIIFCK